MGRVRPFIGGDVPFLHIIDVQGYEQPWTEDEIRKYSRDMFTATILDVPSGYAAVETVGSHLKLIRLVVAAAKRRQRLGSYLMETIISEYPTYNKITTVVAESNLTAQLFLRSQGWKCVNTLPNHFEVCGQTEHGLYFLKKLC